MISDYNEEYPDIIYDNKEAATDICSIHSVYYIYWITSQSFTVLCKFFSIFLAFIAHRRILKNIYMKNVVNENSEEEEFKSEGINNEDKDNKSVYNQDNKEDIEVKDNKEDVDDRDNNEDIEDKDDIEEKDEKVKIE
jgi:phenolic acid decarboxylase